jgi:hypothetical protein
LNNTNNNHNRQNTGKYICALGLAALCALFAIWHIRNPGITVPGFLAALLSAALFAAVCLHFVPGWMDFWSQGYKERPPFPGGRPERRETARIFLVFLGVDAAVILLMYFLRMAEGYGTSFTGYLDFWRCTDSQHYLDIAQDWYLSRGPMDRLVQLVFLPGYPLAVRAMNYIVGNYLYSGLLVAALAFAGAGSVFYRLLRMDYSRADALRTLEYVCILPGAFFFTAPMSDGLFFLLSVSCIYFARRRSWWLAGAMGALASFTRSLGVVLLVPVLFELVNSAVNAPPGTRRKNAWGFLSLLVIPLGFAAYCYINYRVSGDPFKFMQYQREHWGQRLGLFFNTAAYQTENVIGCLRSHQAESAAGLWLPNVLADFGALIITALAARKLRPSYTAYFIAYYVVAIGATWLLSAPRYMLGLMTVPLAVSALTKKPAADRAATVICAVLYLLYSAAFVLRWQVW